MHTYIFEKWSWAVLGRMLVVLGGLLRLPRLLTIHFREISGKKIQDISWKFPGNFRDISGKFPAIFREISRKFPGNFRDISGKFREIPEIPGNFGKIRPQGFRDNESDHAIRPQVFRENES